MPDPVKTPGRRSYRSPHRDAQAARTRHAVLVAARDLMVEHGYAATPVAAVARAAGVSLDTVYQAVGRKPELVRALVEAALSGTDDAVPAEHRDYVADVRAAPTARGKLTRYARAVAVIGSRLGPVHRVLADASVSDPDCAALRREIAERRFAGMRTFAAELRATGELREDLDDLAVADVVWSTSSAEHRRLLVEQRGWTDERFGEWLAETWTLTLLPSAEPARAGGRGPR